MVRVFLYNNGTMKITQIASAEQVIPISKARARLADLVDQVKEKDFFLISRKYTPQVALVDIEFMSKLLSIYQKWQRQQDSKAMEELWEKVPEYSSREIEKDIRDTIREIRKRK